MGKLLALANEVLNKFDARITADESDPKEHTAWNWASEMAHPCPRYLTYCRLFWKERRGKPVDLLYRFREGRNYERQWTTFMMECGYDVLEKGASFNWPKFQIKGSIDGRLAWQGLKPPFEFKSVHPNAWERMTSIEDIARSRSFWTLRTLVQLLIYLLLMNEEAGLLILATFGKRPRVLDVDLQDHLALAEKIVAKADEVNDFVARNEIPAAIPYDTEVCPRCDYDGKCMPVRMTSNLVEVPESAIPKMRRLFELEPYVEEHKDLDAELIGDKKKPGLFYGKEAVVEEFTITSKRVPQTKYNVPKEIKLLYKEEDEYWRTEITRG